MISLPFDSGLDPSMRAVKFVAVDRKSGVAAWAMTAGSRGEDYRIAGSRTRHARADTLDDARAFTAEHARMRHRIDNVVAHRNVGVTNAGGHQPDQHFVGARLGKRGAGHSWRARPRR